MELLWSLLTLPYAPVRGLTAVLKVVAREAEAQRYDPVNVRRELEGIDAAAAAGELTDEQRNRAQQQVLDRLVGPAGPSGGTGAGRREEGGRG
ncbi:gas vesicle protein GvpG [Micromonospora sp. NPDC023956]|uniref:gas vesicle protein GvpG n=1 Tax=Micromonospora sp. NPDC023956 TaxID=3155722 RepID=UPI0033DE9D6E